MPSLRSSIWNRQVEPNVGSPSVIQSIDTASIPSNDLKFTREEPEAVWIRRIALAYPPEHCDALSADRFFLFTLDLNCVYARYQRSGTTSVVSCK